MFSGMASMVEAPGVQGDFGVLPGHMPFISTLRPGLVTIHDEQGKTSQLFVAGGLADVNALQCTLLAERVIPMDKLTRTDAEAALSDATKAREQAEGDVAIAAAERAIAVAEAMINAL